MYSKSYFDNEEPILIAEIGVNHEGRLESAKNLIAACAEEGVWAVKFQSYTTEKFISAEDYSRFERADRFKLNLDEHHVLSDLCHSFGVKFISTPVTEDWVPHLEEICDVLKIASGDINFEPTLCAVAKTELPTIISTGASTLDEVSNALAFFKQHRGDKYNSEVALLHCVSEYPTEVKNTNLHSTLFYAKNFAYQLDGQIM